MPRVLHVTASRHWRGAHQQMLYLTRGLVLRGCQTAVVMQPGAAGAERFEAAGVGVHAVAMRGGLDLGAALRIARLARRGAYSVLHAHGVRAHHLAALASLAMAANCRVIVHRRTDAIPGRPNMLMRLVGRRLGADAFIAVSNQVKKRLVASGVPEWRVFVVRSATDARRFAETRPDLGLRRSMGIPDGAFVIGNIAPLVPAKDHRTLLDAARSVRDRLPETWVIIAGDGPLRESLVARAGRLHMADRLVLTGFRWDTAQLVSAFDVFALSSIDEGIPGTLLDVAAGGCPIVATDAGGVREAVLPERTGILVPTRSPRSLAQAILRVARDPREARAMARAGVERAIRDFTPEALTEHTLRVYRRALAREVRADMQAGYLDD
jgi:glycosyltransferase involved in cell wall biosynthesis